MIIKFKSVSALIATILLIVVAVALIAIILTWGKSFTNTNLTNTNDLLNAPASDSQYYLTIEDGLNGRYLVKYNPPISFYKRSITITRYRQLSNNNIIDLATPIDINSGDTKALDLGIIHSPFDLVLYLDDNTIITKQNIKNTNRSPRTIDCPTGFIPVPGNYLYNTVEGDGGFCVAKYEMKIDETGDGVGDVNASCQNTTYATWNNGAATCGYNAGTRTLVSSASGYPLATISQTTSITACTSIGGHLITNNEWMTLARNIEQVPSNWSSGAIGTGYIYSGHNDGGPNTALAADTNDNNGYYLTVQTTGNQRRTLSLTNGEVIWDLAGNVWEWNNNTIQRKDQPDGFNNVDDSANAAGFNWFDYSKASGGTYYLKSNSLGNTTLGYNDLFLLSSGSYTASINGIGRIYTYSNSADTDTTEYGFLRGGRWTDGTSAGLSALYLYRVPGFTHYYIGFRCVVVP